MRRRAAIALVGALMLTACSGHGSAPKPTLKAAEPSDAPSTSAPVGLVRPVGSNAEGMYYDAATGLLAVAVRDPDRLQILSGRTLAVQRSVPLPGHARHLAAGPAAGTVLVPAEDANRVLTVNLRTGASSAVTVGRSPHDAAVAAGGRIVAGDEQGASVSVVRDGRVERTVTDHVRQPGGVIAFSDEFAVVDVGAFTLSEYDVATGRRIATVAAGQGPTHAVAVANDRVVVADTRGGALERFGLQPLAAAGGLSLPGGPYGLAYDATDQQAWVTLTALNEVAVVDVSQQPMRVVARYPTVPQPNTVAVAPGGARAWIASRRDGTVQEITR